jgi:hypothetical protein
MRGHRRLAVSVGGAHHGDHPEGSIDVERRESCPECLESLSNLLGGLPAGERLRRDHRQQRCPDHALEIRGVAEPAVEPVEQGKQAGGEDQGEYPGQHRVPNGLG